MTPFAFRLARLLGLEDHELGRALRLLSLVFVTSASLVLMKAAQSGIFLAVHGQKSIPWAFAASAVTLASASALLVAAAPRTTPVDLCTRTVVAIASALLGLRGMLFFSEGRLVSFAVYVVIEASAGVLLIQLWSVVSDTLDARSAKRISPLAGVGASLAWGVVGLGTRQLVNLVGAKGLLLLAPALLIVCLVLLGWVARRDVEEKPRKERPSLLESWKTGFSFVSKEQLMRLSLALTVLALVTEQISDYLLLNAARERYTSASDIAGFFGTYYGLTSLLSTAVLLLLSGRIISSLGATKSLALTPLLTSLVAFWTAFVPSFGNKVFLRGADRVLKSALWTSSMEQTQTPLPSVRRAQARALSRGVIAPLAYAVTAMGLAALPATDGRILSLAMGLIMLLMAAIVLMGIRRQYVRALRSAIDHRRLHLDDSPTDGGVREGPISSSQLDGEACLALGREIDASLEFEVNSKSESRATSPEAQEFEARALLACELLGQASGPLAAAALVRALGHRSSLVRVEACEGLSHHRREEVSNALERVLRTDPVSEVRRAAIAALRQNLSPQLHSAFRKAAEDTDRRVRARALVALAQLDVPADVQSGDALLPMFERAADGTFDEEAVEEALFALSKRAGKRPEVIAALALILESAPNSVRLVALEAVTRLRIRSLLSLARPLLEDPATANRAMTTLAGWEEGEGALSLLISERGADEHPSSSPTSSEPRMGNEADPSSQNPVSRLLDHQDTAVRGRATRALASLVRRGGKPVPVALVEPLLDREILVSHQLYGILYGLRVRFGEAAVPAVGLDAGQRLVRSVVEVKVTASVEKLPLDPECLGAQYLAEEIALHLRHSRDRLVHLLGIIEGRTLSRAVQAGLRRANGAQLAQIAELLDVVLRGERTKRLVPLFERLSLKGRVEKAKTLGIPIDEAVSTPIRTLFSLEDRHLEGVATLALPREVQAEHRDRYEAIFPMLPLLSRMQFLRSVPLFSDLSGDDLRQVAQIVEDVRFERGETIFRKGDVGEDLFLILSGKVVIADDGVEFATLGAKDFFGELAVLDREPRSADAVAHEPTELLRLRGPDLGELLARRPQIQEEILLYLVRRVRDLSKRISR